jgi:hypothetical protein
MPEGNQSLVDHLTAVEKAEADEDYGVRPKPEPRPNCGALLRSTVNHRRTERDDVYLARILRETDADGLETCPRVDCHGLGEPEDAAVELKLPNGLWRRRPSLTIVHQREVVQRHNTRIILHCLMDKSVVRHCHAHLVHDPWAPEDPHMPRESPTVVTTRRAGRIDEVGPIVRVVVEVEHIMAT